MYRLTSIVLFFFFAVLLAFSASAQPRDRLAVLDFWIEDEVITEGESQTLTDMLRSAATEASGGRYDVMRRDTMIALLPAEDLRCGIDGCIATIGQKLQAQLVTGGTVRKVGSRMSLTVELYETSRKTALGSRVFIGSTIDELVNVLLEETAALFHSWLPGDAIEVVQRQRPPPSVIGNSGPVVRSGAVREALGDLIVDVKPSDLVRLELTDPSGKSTVTGSPYKNPRAEPGNWRIVAKAPGYEDESQTIFVPADEITPVKWDLKKLGALSITGEPEGAEVWVTGPDGFSHKGALPWEAEGLKSGTYQVAVSRPTYVAYRLEARVASGDTARVQVNLPKAAVTVESGGSMNHIPGGTFLLGTTNGQEREMPVTKVTLSPYYMDRTQVTVDEYRKCVDEGKCSDPNTGGSCNWSQNDRENHPINCVDWKQATEFCSWRGARLPTEAEWEFAAKGTDGRKYPWGNQSPNSGLARWNSGGTAPVGSHPNGASPFGLQDMAGNVWEWVSDRYGSYPGGSVRDPSGPRTGPSRVLRGGSWYDHLADHLRAAYRFWISSTFKYHRVGFRCARDASP